MKGRPVDQVVYDYMFARPKSNDPQNFQALLQRSLIPEVRQETHAFYGHLDTQEAKYPGLDYTHRTHRIRLSRWPWHRRLFRAFESLRLTDAEIAGLTKWEGTKWAKEKYEREQGVSIHDTTSDGFLDWAVIEEAVHASAELRRAGNGYAGLDDEMEDGEMDVESEEELQSVGLELNQRLRLQAARREAGDTSAVLDEEWEMWLKNAIEAGELPFITQRFFNPGNESSSVPAALFPPSMLNAARAGQWTEIPDSLHPILRRTIESEDHNRSATRANAPISQQAGETASSSRSSAPSNSLRRHFMDNPHRVRNPWPRRTYSDLRLPLGDPTSSQRPTEA